MRHGQTGEAACDVSAKQGCCSAADAADARRVADVLGIPFYVLNFEKEFARVIDYFVDEYVAGRTPNPCVVCNTWLKFGKLLEYADGIGAEFVATGHYARLTRQDDGQIALCRGIDPAKDQAYVLFGIDRRVLPRVLFPVGEHHKEEIRGIAERLGLRVADKPDSQEICFVPDRSIRAGADDAEAQRCKLLPVVVVEFVTVPVTFGYLLAAVALERLTAVGQRGWLRAQPHGSAHVGDRLLFVQEANDRGGRVLVEFRRVRVVQSRDVSGEFGHGALHAQTDAEERNAAFSREANGVDRSYL